MSAPRPWVEKYRPATLDDVVDQKEIVSVLKQADFPNLLFYGPPGTGKTSSILTLANKMFKNRVLHLNASDERGIQVIRERVRKFAQTTASRTVGGDSAEKLVILDEADSMTSAAQSCLRRIMEIYSKTTRFCLICNYVSRIIAPIASRCSKFRFQPITDATMQERLDHICQCEGVKYTDDSVMEHLIYVCDGDLRRAITILQSAHRLAGPNNQIDLNLIHEVSGFIPKRHMNRFVAICKSKSLEKMEAFVSDIISEGYTASQFLSQLHDWLLLQSDLGDSSLSKILPAIALAEHRFCNGSDEYIQLLYVASIAQKNFDSASQATQSTNSD